MATEISGEGTIVPDPSKAATVSLSEKLLTLCGLQLAAAIGFPG